MNRTFRLIAVAATLAASGAFAQTQIQPVAPATGAPRAPVAGSATFGAQVEAAQRALPATPVITPRDEERARSQARMPSEATVRGMAGARVDPSQVPQPVTPAPAGLLEDIARGFNAQTEAVGDVFNTGPALMVMVSFSMPTVTLKRLAEQAQRADAALILRGLINASFADTLKRVHETFGPLASNVQIDPLAFDHFSVESVPAFVLVADRTKASACGESKCMANGDFATLSGDVSLGFAVSRFAAQPGAIGKAASGYAQRLGVR